MARRLGFGDPFAWSSAHCASGPVQARAMLRAAPRTTDACIKMATARQCSQPAGPQANPGPFPSFPSNLTKADPALQASALRLFMIWSGPCGAGPLERSGSSRSFSFAPRPQGKPGGSVLEREKTEASCPSSGPEPHSSGSPHPTPAQASVEVCSVPHTHSLAQA